MKRKAEGGAEESMKHRKQAPEEPEDDEYELKERFWGPTRIIGSIAIALLMILTVIPYYNLKLDPSPGRIPSISEVFNATDAKALVLNRTSSNEIASYLMVDNELQLVKQTASGIAMTSCRENKVCNAKAIFYFVRNNINYISDPVSRDYFQTPLETLSLKSGDCDDFAILASNLMRSIGINTRLVMVPGHAYLQINLADAPKSYKEGSSNWVNLDPTCSNCEFGKLTPETVKKQKVYIG